MNTDGMRTGNSKRQTMHHVSANPSHNALFIMIAAKSTSLFLVEERGFFNGNALLGKKDIFRKLGRTG
jgi:hypothetical protein